MNSGCSSRDEVSCDSKDPGANHSVRERPDWVMDLVLVLFICGSLVLYGAIAAPVPAVNEPHYFTKGLHYWAPTWCQGDFFLDSPNAHAVYYATFGWLTTFLSFEVSAWLGRAISMLLLALSWVRVGSVFLVNRISILLSCWVYLAIAACGSLSGEWLVGGVEGKVVCYALLMTAFAEVYRPRLLFAGILAGTAISFHPVVGVWGVTAFGLSQVTNWLAQKFRLWKESPSQDSGSRPAGLTVLAAICLLGAFALPGLIPVVRLLAEVTTAEVKRSATYIQVYYRLAHHLDPMVFSWRSYVGYLSLLMVWGFGFVKQSRSKSTGCWNGVVFWAVMFALGGWLAGVGPRPPKDMPWFMERAVLLKFYPFRLIDVLLPIAVSLVVAKKFDCVAPRSRSNSVRVWGIASLVFVVALVRAGTVRESNRFSNEDRNDWLDVCEWVRSNLPSNALVQAPHNGWAFKWFAQRAEFVTFKDCPQDSAGIVEWNRRLNFLAKWTERYIDDGLYSIDELKAFRKETGITHWVSDYLGPFELEPIYRNSTFQVYDLSSLDDPSSVR